MNRKKIKQQEEEDIVIEMVSIIDRLFCDDYVPYVIVFCTLFFMLLFLGMYICIGWVCYVVMIMSFYIRYCDYFYSGSGYS
jgi:hypothetical protein